ncbi:MAG: AsmA family protein [SAR324 cluster bacterium]|nr:AsmA family protein [SAR324 cluster bacterium]
MKTRLTLLIKLVLLLTGLVGIGVTILFLLVNPNDYKEDFTELIKASTGLEIVFEDDFKLSVFPSLSVKLGSIYLKDTANNGNETFARIGKAQINIKLLPLLSKELEIKAILIEALQLYLIQDKSGQANWETLLGSSETGEATAANTDDPDELMANLYIRKLSVKDASISWKDEQANKHALLNNLNLTIEDIRPNAPLKFDLSLILESSELPEKASLSFQGQASVNSNQVTLDNITLKLNDSTIQGNVKINHLAHSTESPQYFFDLELDSLDIDRYLTTTAEKGPQPQKNSRASPKEGTEDPFAFLRSLQLEGTLKAKTLKAANVRADNLQVTLQTKKGLLQLKQLETILYGANFSSTLTLDVTQQSGMLDVPHLSLSTAEGEISGQIKGRQIFTEPVIQGNLTAPPFNLKKLLTTLGQQPPVFSDPDAFSSVSANLAFTFQSNSLNVENLTIHLDESTLHATAALSNLDKEPHYQLQLTVDSIDFNRYLSETKDEEAPDETTQEQKESPFELPLELLRSLQTEGKVEISQAKASYFEISDLLFKWKAEKGLLEINPSAQLHEGIISAGITLDLRDNPKERLNRLQLSLKNLHIQSILKNFVKDGERFVPWSGGIEAKLDGALDLIGQTFEVNPLKIKTPSIQASLQAKGSQLFTEPKLQGQLAIFPFNLKRVLSRLQLKMPETTDKKALTSAAVDSSFKADSNKLVLHGLILKLDRTTLQGEAQLLDFSNPSYVLQLEGDTLDVDRYLPPSPNKKNKQAEQAPTAEAGDSPEFLTQLRLKGNLKIARLKVADIQTSQFQTKIEAKEGMIELQLDADVNNLPGQKTLPEPLHLHLKSDLDTTAQTLKMNTISLSNKEARVDGQINGNQLFGKLTIDGKLHIPPFQPQKLLPSLGLETLPITDKKALEAVSAELAFLFNLESTKLDIAHLQIDESVLRGKFQIKDYTHPHYTFDLHLDTVDVDRYLPPPAARQSTQKRRPEKTHPLPLDILRALELQGKVQIDKIKGANVRASNASVRLNAHNGLLKISPLQATLYRGSVSSTIALDLRKQKKKKNLVQLDIEKVQLQPLLTDLQMDQQPEGELNVKLDGALDLEKKTFRVGRMNGSVLGVQFSGQAEGTQIFTAPRVSGQLEIPPFNPKKLLATLGQPAPTTANANALTSLSTEFSFNLSSDHLTLKPLLLKLDESTAQADVQINNFTAPQTVFDLNIDHIDVDRYLPPAPKQKTAAATKKEEDTGYSLESTADLLNQGALELGQGLNALWNLPESLLSPPGKIAAAKIQTRQKTATEKQLETAPLKPPQDSSDSSIPFFQTLQARGNITIDRLKAGNVTASKLRAKINSNQGLLRVEPFQASLYQGTLSSTILLNTSRVVDNTPASKSPSPKNQLVLTIKDVETGPLIKDFSGEELLFGKINLNAAVNYVGLNIEKIRKTLSGHVRLAVADAGIKGVSLTQVFKDFAGQFSEKSLEVIQQDKDELMEIKASTQITNGLFSNKDLSVKLPLMRLDGHGQLHAVTEKISYLLKTSLVPSIEGQGGADNKNLFGLTIPVRITGPLQNISYELDIGEMLPDLSLEKGIQATGKLVENIGEGIEETGKAIHGVGKELGAGVNKGVKVLEENVKAVGKKVGLDKGIETLEEGAQFTGKTIEKGTETLEEGAKATGEVIEKGFGKIGKGAQGVSNMLENIFQDKKSD